MWIDDPYWMPHLLGDRFFIGTLGFEGYDRLIKENVNIENEDILQDDK